MAVRVDHEANIALAQLPLTTARSLDEVVASGERHYIVDRLARAHLSVVKALEQTPEPDGPDRFSEFLAQITTPTPGTAGPDDRPSLAEGSKAHRARPRANLVDHLPSRTKYGAPPGNVPAGPRTCTGHRETRGIRLLVAPTWRLCLTSVVRIYQVRLGNGATMRIAGRHAWLAHPSPLMQRRVRTGAATLALLVGGIGALFLGTGMAGAYVPTSIDQLYGVACTSASWCVAVGTTLYQKSGNDPLVEMFDGSAWSIVPSPDVPGDDYLTGVSCVNSDYCMAVGYSAGNVYSTIAEMWNGSAWSIVPSPNAGTYQNFLEGVDCTSMTNCVAVGSYASTASTYPLIEAWNGSAWSIADDGTGLANDKLRSVSCVGTDFCMAVGNGVGVTWNGTDWNVIGTAWGSENASVSCTSSSSCEAVFGPAAASFDGTSWSSQSTPEVGDLNGVTCFDSSDCLGVGWVGSQSLVESLTGTTWSVVASPDPGGLDNILAGVSCVSLSACAAVGNQSTTDAANAYTLAMEWDGTQWSTSPTQNDGVLASPNLGPPGTAIHVSGGGFQPDEQVTVTYKGDKRSHLMCNALASSNGVFSCTGIVPKNPGAPNLDLIIARGETSGIKAETNFYPT